MEATTIQKFIHTTPRKLRLVARMVGKMEPTKALEVLQITNKAAVKDLMAAIQTVLANAKHKGMEKVLFKTIEINEGSKMKRYRAGTRGRARPYVKKMSHIKIVLTDESKEKLQLKNKKEGGNETKVEMDNSADNAK